MATLKRGIKGSSDPPKSEFGDTDMKFKSVWKVRGPYDEPVLVKVWSNLSQTGHCPRPSPSCGAPTIVTVVTSPPGRQVSVDGTRDPAFPIPQNRIPGKFLPSCPVVSTV